MLVLLSLTATCLADSDIVLDSFMLVDIMNSALILISCIFVISIVGTLRNKKRIDLIKSAHFFKIKKIISVWTFLGSAILIYGLTQFLWAFRILTDPAALKFLHMLFGVLFALGLFIEHSVLHSYISQFDSAPQEEIEIPIDG